MREVHQDVVTDQWFRKHKPTPLIKVLRPTWQKKQVTVQGQPST